MRFQHVALSLSVHMYRLQLECNKPVCISKTPTAAPIYISDASEHHITFSKYGSECGGGWGLNDEWRPHTS